MLAAVLCYFALLVGHRRHTQRSVLPMLAAPLLCLAIIISVAATHWPLRASCAPSRGALDALDALAQRVRSGGDGS